LLPQTTNHLGQAESEAAISKKKEKSHPRAQLDVEERKLIMIGNYNHRRALGRTRAQSRHNATSRSPFDAE